MNTELTELLNESKLSVDNHPKHELVLPMRRKIWAQMGSHRDKNALYKRFELSKMCVEKVLPLWDQSFPEDVLVTRLLHDASAYLKSNNQDFRTQLNLHADKLSSFLDKNMMHPATTAIYVGMACYCTARIILGDDVPIEHLNDFNTLDDDLDPFSWDASYYAAGAYAGEVPDDIEENSDGECNVYKLKEFWYWYLEEAVPSI